MDTVILAWKNDDGAYHAFTLSKSQMQQILARACNSWEKAPIPVRELHDLVVHGKLLQQYATMPKYISREDLSETENMQLDQRLKSAAEKSTQKNSGKDSQE